MEAFAELVDGTRPETESLVFRVRAADGAYRLLETLGRNLRDDPEVRGTVLNSRDITTGAFQQRAELGDELGQADVGDSWEFLEQRGFGMHRKRVAGVTLKLGDLGVQNSDLCDRRGDDTCEHCLRDRLVAASAARSRASSSAGVLAPRYAYDDRTVNALPIRQRVFVEDDSTLVGCQSGLGVVVAAIAG